MIYVIVIESGIVIASCESFLRFLSVVLESMFKKLSLFFPFVPVCSFRSSWCLNLLSMKCTELIEFCFCWSIYQLLLSFNLLWIYASHYLLRKLPTDNFFYLISLFICIGKTFLFHSLWKLVHYGPEGQILCISWAMHNNVFHALLVTISITTVGVLNKCLCEGMIAMLVFLFSFAVDEDTLLALAHQKYKAGNYKQALEHSNSVYERNPRRTDNLLLLGAIHYQVFSCLLFILFAKSSSPWFSSLSSILLFAFFTLCKTFIMLSIFVSTLIIIFIITLCFFYFEWCFCKGSLNSTLSLVFYISICHLFGAWYKLLLPGQELYLIFSLFLLFFPSCMILICASQRMKKLFILNHILQSALETWQMRGR